MRNGKLLTLLVVSNVIQCISGGVRDEVKARAGGSVSLRCAVNRARCGDFHSIKWYKENRRVFVYSPVVDFSKAEGELLERGSLSLDNQEAKLTISPVQTTDEGEYKCEITFLDISKNCPVVQLVKLTTLAEPKYANISLSSGNAGPAERQIVSNSVVGPFNEGTDIVLICESGGGKPIPQVSWYINNQQVPGRASSSEEADRTGTGRSELAITVGRAQLGAKLECRAGNEAISEPLISSIQLDVSLRPESIRISGADKAVEQGSVVSLLCVAKASRPAAVLTWYNGSALFPEQPAGQVSLEPDGTYLTTSRLSFIASRFEDNEKIFCEGNNEVLQFYKEEPVRADTRLEVLYPPVVMIQPTNITVNASDQVIIRCTYESNPSALLKVKWYHNGKMIDTLDSRYEGGTLNQPSLKIKSSTKNDIGTYSCVLENEMGSGTSQYLAYLDVYYRPQVKIRMEPDSPINELDRTNVTLFCDLVEGNPPVLHSVRWFMDKDLLKQLPQCGNQDDDLCDIDPSKLLLEHVSRHFHGNFSCIGMNEAGPSIMSRPVELQVHYPPGNATIVKDTERVVKGSKLTLTCLVPDLGRPRALAYKWILGGHVVNHITTESWTIDPVTLETQSNVSCMAVNHIGTGSLDATTIQVSAPPSFIESLHPYTGFTATSANVSLLCQVECSPLCDILWLKDGVPITDNSDYFTIRTRQVPPNYSKNDFESVKSMLLWNLENWPHGKLNRNEDNTNYSCKSSSNEVGKGVSSATHFRVEYPPDNLFISQEVVNVVENKVPEKVLCTAEAYPEASFMWRFNDEVIQTHNLLNFASAITRDQAGVYVCEAQNRHGTSYITTKMNVMYKPECTIHQEKVEDKILLTCESDANPDEVTFLWKKGNGTYDGDITMNGLQSTIRLGLLQESFGTYFCFVNNSVGLGVPCEIDIQGIGVMKNISDTNIIVIVAVIAASLVALMIVVVLIVVCRRKSVGEKCPNLSEGNKENEIAGNPPGQPQPVHKWPLRPGVHVHVNGLNTLTGSDNKINHQISGFSYGAKTSRSSSSSGSDWASNTSSNPELNSDSDPKRNPRQNISGINGLGTHQELTTGPAYGANDLASNGSRPNSRQRKKRDGNKSNSNNAQSDQLLPTFYENVSSIQNRQKPFEERLRESHSQSPALDIQKGAHDIYNSNRPSSQLSAHTLHAFGSTRSSRASKHSASPCPDSRIKPTSHYATGVSDRSQYCVLQAPCRMQQEQGKLDLAEAEVESNPDTSKNPDVMIEYTPPVPPHTQYSYSHEAPIFSSLTNFKSLPRHPAAQNGQELPIRHLPTVPTMYEHEMSLPSRNNNYSRGPPYANGLMLSEPISPPKQFDSPYTGGPGLRVQPHSIGGGPGREEAY